MEQKKWITGKPSDLEILGLKVSSSIVNDVVKEIILSNENGSARISPAWEQLTVQVPAPPKTVTKYSLTGEFIGIPLRLMFDDRDEAERKVEELKEVDVTASAIITEIEVPEE
jgi:hypothetical protein